jgi:hypothetical protein
MSRSLPPPVELKGKQGKAAELRNVVTDRRAKF